MPVSWSNEEIFKFIDLYQSEPAIWDSTNALHKDKNKVNDAWNRIADSLQIPISELKKKKETLMAAFRFHLKKKQDSIRSGMGEEEIYKPIWIFYDVMEAFLKPKYTCKSLISTDEQSKYEEDLCGPIHVRRNMVAEFILSQQQLMGGGGPLGPAPPSPRPQSINRGRLSVSPHFPMEPPMNGGPEDYPPGFDFSKRKEFFGQRKQREFIPDNKKDDGYWDRRRRNNEAAKRSREKRRFNDMVLEQRVVELSKENHVMKAQLDAIKEKYGICGEALISIDQVLATLPTCDQVLCVTKRSKLSGSGTFLPGPPPPPPPPASPPSHHSPPPQRAPEPYQERLPAPETYYSHPAHYEPPGSVLNLSRSRRAPSPYELSSLSGSGDETAEQYPSENHGLPLKLRHKSHLGDKDVASALLSLQNIKQEPGPRSSPSWDGEGSSDERDSGISLNGEYRPVNRPDDRLAEEEDAHLKAELARLATEVATLKNMMHQNKARGMEH